MLVPIKIITTFFSKPMKNIFKLTVLLVILTVTRSKAQIAYYDAVKLDAIFSAGTLNDSTFKIASNILYNYSNKSDSNPFAVQAQFQTNPFVPAFYKVYTPTTPALTNLARINSLAPPNAGIWSSGGGAFQQGLSSLGSTDVTAFADGIAQFLVDRAKAELDEAFFDKLKDFMDDYPEVETLFPNTYVLLNNFKSYEYANLLNTLKEAFDKDLKLLPADIIKLKDLDINDCLTGAASGYVNGSYCAECQVRVAKIKNFFSSDAGIFLLSGLQIGNGVLQKQPVPEIINSVVQPGFLLGYTNTGNPALAVNIKNSLRLINTISQSIKSDQPGANYINNTDFDNLINNGPVQHLFFALLYQQIYNQDKAATMAINGVNLVGKEGILKPNDVSGVINYLKNLYSQAKNLELIYATLEKDKLNLKADLSQDYIVLFQTLQQVFQSSFALDIIDPNLSTTQVANQLNTIAHFTNASLQIANDITVRNYNAAVMGTLSILSEVVNVHNAGDQDLKLFLSSFLKYGSFASNIILAKNAGDAEKALEAVALPVGSYSIKQRSATNISVNGYLGYGFDIDPKHGLYARGLYAPVGFSASIGLGPKLGGALTFFASVIDVGALVSYKLQNTTASGSNTDTMKQEVRLESIFSPSAQIFFEIPRWPVAIGTGWRMTPKLFYSNNSTLTAVPAKSVINVAILIDIPILTLHNTPYKTSAGN